MTSRLCLTLSVLAVLTAGCATDAGPRHDACDWAAPIRPSRADQLSAGTARQILTHNETGADLCGWRP
jgi:hypothetical protein